MRKGKYQTRRSGMSVKALSVLLAVVLSLTCVVGGTIAWLTDKTEEVVNTFTVGNIDITLEETKTDFKMVPGSEIEKDPVASVLKGSEASWLFVRVEESKQLSDYIDYTIADGWTEYTKANTIGTVKYYYRAVDSLVDAEEDAAFSVLKDNKVTVKTTVTKEMMDSISGEGKVLPQLIFAAAAVQQANINGVDGAWANLPVEFKI